MKTKIIRAFLSNSKSILKPNLFQKCNLIYPTFNLLQNSQLQSQNKIIMRKQISQNIQFSMSSTPNQSNTQQPPAKVKTLAVNSPDYEQIKKFLLDIDFFQRLPRQVFNALLKVAIVRTYKPGEQLSNEGVADPYLHVVYSGTTMYKKKQQQTDLKRSVYQKEDILVGFKYPTAIIGLTGLILQNDQHTVSFYAKSDCKIVSFSYEDCQKLLIKNEEISNLLLKHFAYRIRKSNVKFAEIISKQDDSNIKKVAFFDSKDYMRNAFEKVLEKEKNLKFEWIESKLNINTVVLAKGCQAACVFVNDNVNLEVLSELKGLGVSMLALRSTGYNNVDLQACKDLEMSLCRVTTYSPYAIAEHAAALLLSLNRKIPLSQYKIKTHNFQLGGLVGMDLYQKTIGVIGTGKIGMKAIDIFRGFGMKVLAYDVYPDKSKESEQVQYVDLETLYKNSDIITLFCPLLDSTYHMINDNTIAKMKDGVIIINTSRGPVVDTQALIKGLKSGKIQGAGLDVVEGEQEYFFEDYSNKIIINDNFNRLLSFNNVIVTGHQAFLTNEALHNIASTTVDNFKAFFKGLRGKDLPNNVLLL